MKTKKPTDTASISADLRAKTPASQSPERDERGKKDWVAEGSVESFPASDTPTHPAEESGRDPHDPLGRPLAKTKPRA